MADQSPVTAAMSASRPAKETIRNIWVNEVRLRKLTTDQQLPFYLTLAGANGFDIQALIDARLIATTENDAIADIDNRRVIAVESDSLAVLQLQTKYKGLKVVEGNIFDQLRGTSPIAFPSGGDRTMMRSTVINLDLNASLAHRNNSHPVLDAILKLCALHQEPPLDWTLFLTLQGEITWDEQSQRDAQSFVIEKCQSYNSLANCCQNLLGKELYAKIEERKDVVLADLSDEEQQAFLLIFVPMVLMHKLIPLGWRLEIAHSIKYGGTSGAAPMCTWVIRFLRDPRTAASPTTVTHVSYGSFVHSPSYIDEEGNVTALNRM